MIYCSDEKPFKAYGKVWKVTPSEKYIDIQMTTSEKDTDGNYVNSRWFARVIGHAFNSIKNLKEGDRIIINKCKLTNESYTDNDGNKKSRFRFLILDAEIEGATPPKSEKKEEPKQEATEAPATDDTCPW